MTDDEILSYRLTPEGLNTIENEQDDECRFLLHCIQSAEALEQGDRSEEELLALFEWYQNVQLDHTLIEMVLCGDLYVVGMQDAERGIVSFKATPQGLAKVGQYQELPSLDA